MSRMGWVFNSWKRYISLSLQILASLIQIHLELILIHFVSVSLPDLLNVLAKIVTILTCFLLISVESMVMSSIAFMLPFSLSLSLSPEACQFLVLQKINFWNHEYLWFSSLFPDFSSCLYYFLILTNFELTFLLVLASTDGNLNRLYTIIIFWYENLTL